MVSNQEAILLLNEPSVHEDPYARSRGVTDWVQGSGTGEQDENIAAFLKEVLGTL